MREAFQSTPSVWKATKSNDVNTEEKQFQSTPSVWKATDGVEGVTKDQVEISIHAFRVEGDAVSNSQNFRPADFNPRLPCGRRPQDLARPLCQQMISIHAFRVEGDNVFLARYYDEDDFNPRLPCGRRLQKLTGDLLNTHIICIDVHKAVALFYNQWHRKPLSTLLFYNFFGANGTVILCLHPIRTKTATLLQHQNRYSRRSVRLWFYSYCRDNRT